MENKREMTAPNVSVGADTEQPIQKCTDHSISDYDENIKNFEEMQRETKNEILNSTSSKGSRFYFCTVDIYSFIHSWYGYLSF